MDSSDSLQLDEHLARLLAAYDQEIDGGDPQARRPSTSRCARREPPRRTSAGHAAAPGRRRTKARSATCCPTRDRPIAPTAAPALVTTPAPDAARTASAGSSCAASSARAGAGSCSSPTIPKLQREVALKIPRPEMLLSPDATPPADPRGAGRGRVRPPEPRARLRDRRNRPGLLHRHRVLPRADARRVARPAGVPGPGPAGGPARRDGRRSRSARPRPRRSSPRPQAEQRHPSGD